MLYRVSLFIRQYLRLICFLCLLVSMACLGRWVVLKNQREKEALSKFEERGELYSSIFVPSWIKSIGFEMFLSRERFRELTHVIIRTDTELAELASHTNLSYLSTVELRGNKITPRGLSQLAHAWNLRTLNLVDVTLRKEESLQVPPMQNLQAIQIKDSIIDAQILEQFAKSPQINWLSFYSVDFPNEWLHACEKMPYLSSVLIDDCSHITDEELGHFKSIEGLNSLQLIDVPVSVSCLEHFRKTKSLYLFDIRRGKKHTVTTQDLQILKEQFSFGLFGIDLPIEPSALQLISEIQTITSINLPVQNVTESELKTLCEMPKLQKLTLGGKHLTPEGVNILNAKKDLQLTIEGLPDSVTQLRAFQKLAQPFSIGIEGQFLTVDQMKVLGTLSLESLSMKNCQFPPKTLTGLTNISNLILDNVELTNEELTELVQGKSYFILYIINAKLNDETIPILSQMGNVSILNLKGNNFTQAGKKKLKAAIPNTTVGFGEFLQTTR